MCGDKVRLRQSEGGGGRTRGTDTGVGDKAEISARAGARARIAKARGEKSVAPLTCKI